MTQKELIQNPKKIFQALVENSKDVFEIITKDGTIKYTSGISEDLTGYNSNDRVGRSIYEFCTEKSKVKLHSMINQAIYNPGDTIEDTIVVNSQSKGKFHLEVHIQNMLDDGIVNGIFLVFRDITNRINMEHKIYYINNYDDVTGLYNKNHFNQHLRELCESKKTNFPTYALMMLELENLNEIVYNLEYEIGNKLIIGVAERLREYLGDKAYISRYSDNNIAIIIRNRLSNNQYKNIAESIICMLTKPFQIGKYELELSVSMGIHLCNGDSQSTKTVKKQVFAALNRSIKNGGNCYSFYSKDFDIKNYKDFMIRNDISKAIKRNQLKMFYMPVVELKTGKILGAEAVVKWKHPDWGDIFISEIITIAEETNVISDIEDWALEEVCKTYRGWMDDGRMPINISMKFSGIRFYENDFVDKILDVTNRYQVPPQTLIVEVSKLIFEDKVDRIMKELDRMQSHGIQIALSDLGAGNSSWAYLNKCPIDIIKINKSFIKGIGSDITGSIILKSLLNMMKELKVQLVAEGIEDWEQLTFLKNHNCMAGQGNIYGKALSYKDFEKILIRGRCKPQKINNLEVGEREERRKLFRIKFHQYLEADLTIKEVGNKPLEIGSTPILIEDIGAGGLKIISDIRFPARRSILLKISTELLGKDIDLIGTILRTEELSNGLYGYGIKLIMDENDRTKLINLLNEIQIKMRNNVLFNEGSFTSLEPPAYFKENKCKTS